jgi:hypothetical protein
MFLRKLFLLILVGGFASAQKLDIKYDYENSPVVSGYWKANDQVKFEIDTEKKSQLNEVSKACLKVRFSNIRADQKNVWFTDLKMDSLANPKMEQIRLDFGGELWLSFWCKVNTGDTLWLNPLMLTQHHEGKWSSKSRAPVFVKDWTFIKFNLAALEYSHWGEGPEVPDLSTNLVRCFEIGFMNGSSSPIGFVEARFDDYMLSKL